MLQQAPPRRISRRTVGVVVIATAALVGIYVFAPGPEDAPRPSPTAAGGVCAPWSSCPEADLLRAHLTRAGYRLVGETATAIIVTGHGRNHFYAGASTLDEVNRAERAGEIVGIEDAGWRRLFRVGAVSVFGDNVRLTWETAHYRVWVQTGPGVSDRRPSLAQINALVRETETW